MFRNKKIRRFTALFLLLNMVHYILWPTLSYALTAGPSAPETSSFEPVDTTDMVNLLTGDFTYNVPLLEVPGPGGGYPLSLSYHAGIKLDQEASWIGLGWTLNPGAINRTVNGYADDAFYEQRTVKDYWGGGEATTRSHNLGLSIPGSGIGLNVGWVTTRDTYKGFSSTTTAGLGFSLPLKSGGDTGTGLNLGLGLSSDGNVGVSITKPLSENRSISLTQTSGGLTGIGYTDRHGASYGLSHNTSSGASGASIQTRLGGAVGQTSGFTNNQGNSSAGNITSFTKTKNGGEVNLGFGSFSLKEQYTRYWSDESQDLYTYGVLHAQEGNNRLEADSYGNPNDDLPRPEYFAFDTYNMYDDSSQDPNDKNDPNQQLGGSFPSYDSYMVLGQGLAGAMQPVILENGDLYNQNFYDRNKYFGTPVIERPIIGYKSMGDKFTIGKVDFRFLNDFSNHVEVTPPSISENGGAFTIVANDVTAEDPQGLHLDVNNQHLAGSRHIEWYTNQEIYNGSAGTDGFIDFYEDPIQRKLSYQIYRNYLQPEMALPQVCYREGLPVRGGGSGSFTTDKYVDHVIECGATYGSLKPLDVDISKKIGGFKITNESGVTYHYALPVYVYNQYTRSKLKSPVQGVSTFREYKNDEPVAYTWLLTAITGPDFVDRNTNRKLDDQDWGYWVKFDYGLWTDSYQWRTPHTGYNDNIESEYATFSHGFKELYYLDAIETKTHKALFIKSIRKDGRGVTNRLEGGSKPRKFELQFYPDRGLDIGTLKYNVSPVSTLKLDKIYLFKKDQLSGIPLAKDNSDKYDHSPIDKPEEYGYKGPEIELSGFSQTMDPRYRIKEEDDFVYVKYHNGDLVYDDGDVENIASELQARSLKSIDFQTDYSLAPGTPNSIGYYSDFPGYDPAQNLCDQEVYEREYPFRGNGCIDGFLNTTPCPLPQQPFDGAFKFFSRDPLLGTVSIYHPCEPESSNQFYRGDELDYHHIGKLTLNKVKVYGKGGSDHLPAMEFAYNPDNPNYNKDKFDIWQYYKNDYTLLNGDLSGETVATPMNTRQPSDDSALRKDVWSLQSITTSLGAKIQVEYESDDYSTSVMDPDLVFSLEKMERDIPGKVKLTFKEKKLPLSSYFSINDNIDLNAFVLDLDLRIDDFKGRFDAVKFFIDRDTYGDFSVHSVGTDYLIFTHNELYNTMFGTDKYFVSGFVRLPKPAMNVYGDGLRVKALTVGDALGGDTYSTSYDYHQPGTTTSSGSTSFTPYNQPSVIYPIQIQTLLQAGLFFGSSVELMEDYRHQWQQRTNQPFAKLMALVRYLPAPGVIYEYVTVRQSMNGNDFPSYDTYQHQVFEEPMIEKTFNDHAGNTEEKRRREVMVKNYSHRVGNLISATKYRSGDLPVSKVAYKYLLDDNVHDFPNEQGVVEQAFHQQVEVNEYKSQELISSKTIAMTSKLEEYTDVLMRVISTDYKIGVNTVTENLAFDFYSGATVSTLSVDSKGNHIITENIPAYRQYPAMGLKVNNPNGKNMLAQGTATYTYKVNSSDFTQKLGLLNASVQTWSDQVPVLQADTQPGIWRKQSNYQWNGSLALQTDGTYPTADFLAHGFDWTTPGVNGQWEKVGEVTLYDGFSHGLEAQDINGQYAATRMGPEQYRVIANVAPSSYNEMAFSGAEFYSHFAGPEGGVDRGQGVPSTARSHTGKYSLVVSPGTQGFNYTLNGADLSPSKKYWASVWVYLPGDAETTPEINDAQLYYDINGVQTSVHPEPQKNKSKSWYLLNLLVEPNGSNDILIGCRNQTSRGIYFDDFRVHPLGAAMNTYVYDQTTDELTYILDADNLYTRFAYDEMGRLVKTTREHLNFPDGDFKADQVVNEVIYNYGN